MMHITEDTPPDMLAGSMDLIVHLPANRSVKMSVERSTPMMDLLVHITSAHQLQLSNHIIQALEMAPSSERSDKVLPYKPNTPIGALDTQHVRVIAKNKNFTVPKNVPPGYQPFESTFRLQVHLPRNQLYVIRVSQHVYLEDILKRVCEEKNLDIRKYELRHPGNLDEVLDLKLTLSDYKITEIYVVAKGTVGLAQTFSSSDIMGLRKDEERKQMHAKTGGGVFNLIFKKGRSSTGSGSLSSENRSISPVHSDDSRSVTPPTVQPSLPKERGPATERPKPPQRKRRPAPKPPQKSDSSQISIPSKPSSQVSTNSDPSTILDLQSKATDNNGLTICHSRNSSDSSGYHEPSVLSENCNNTSLPRRPKSAVISEITKEKNERDEHTEEVSGNLSKMAGHSKSLSSLAAGRKKRAAPPPPVLKATSTIDIDKPSPVVATTAVTVERSSPVVVSPPIKKSESISPFYNTQTSISTKTSSESSSLLLVERTSLQGSNNKEETELILNIKVQSEKQTEVEISDVKANQQQHTLDQLRKDTLKLLGESPTSSEESREEKNTIQQKLEKMEPNDNADNQSIEPKENEMIQTEVSKIKLSKEDNLPNIKSVTRNINNDNKSQHVITSSENKQEQNYPVPDPVHNVEISPSNLLSTFVLPDTIEKEETRGLEQEAANDTEIDWQYQLPPPPSAFRDDCASSLADATNYDTVTLEDFKSTDSLVTQSELFEKPQVIRNGSEMSDVLSVKSEEEKPYSKLSLENLEKRKSLVYNRELSTSLKMTCEDNVNDIKLPAVADQNTVLRSEPETIFKSSEVHKSSNNVTVSRNSSHSQEYTKKPVVENHLPNFKITTYDNPKKKINIFEDDSIRSNAEITKKYPVQDTQSNESSKNFTATVSQATPEKILVEQKPINLEIKSQEFEKREPTIKNNHQFRKLSESSGNIIRSESFSNNSSTMNYRKPSKPVKRSKSQVALNHYVDVEGQDSEEHLSRSNSLFDISGLQSLEVMRVIQNKLNLSKEEHPESKSIQSTEKEKEKEIEIQTADKKASQPPPPPPTKETTNTQKTYTYQGPPSVCLGTWSERPKTQVSLKEDTDYRVNSKNIINSIKSNLNNAQNAKDNSHYFNTQSNSVNNSYTFKVNKQNCFNDIGNQSKGVNVKINGVEPFSRQKPIEAVANPDDKFLNKTPFNKNISSTFINYNLSTSYRKPLGNVNEKVSRPHSIALDSNFDVSRVPIVRSVELKKDVQITNNNFLINNLAPAYKSEAIINNKETNNYSLNESKLFNKQFKATEEKYADTYQSSESLNELSHLKNKRSNFYVSSNQSTIKPVARVNSFGQAPTVMGFRTNELKDDKPVQVESRPYKSNLRTTQSELRPKTEGIPNNNGQSTNRHTIFGDVVLRRTPYQKANSNFRFSTGDVGNGDLRGEYGRDECDSSVPPPPPQLPKITSLTKKASVSENSSSDARAELLDAIRSFGGKKNLRRVKT